MVTACCVACCFRPLSVAVVEIRHCLEASRFSFFDPAEAVYCQEPEDGLVFR